MPRLRNLAVPALIAATLVTLTACVGQQGPFADLDTDREADDTLPQLENHAYEHVDVASSRFVGEHEGTSLWLAHDVEGSGACLIADAGEGEWNVGCGGDTGLTVDGMAGLFAVVPNNATAPEGATQISENVYAW